MEAIKLETTCVLSERWPVLPFNGRIDDVRFRMYAIDYEVKFIHRPYLIDETQNLTVLKLKHVWVWEGSEDQFSCWGREEGEGEIAWHISDIVNRLIDLVQATHYKTELNPFPHIRHVGIRDFLLIDTLCGPRRQNLVSIGNITLDARTARRSIGALSTINFTTADEPTKETIKLLRAVELLNCGYRTEALLVAFSILDSAVQEALSLILEDRGVSEPEAFLKKVTKKRLEKFLDPLLKKLTGHSLKKDNPELWDKLGTVNNNRNRAMHRAIDMDYRQSKEGIETIRDILLYISKIPRPITKSEESDDKVAPKLDIEDLPFLMEW
ncbi:hypothetical protein ACFLXA_01585 [Chloroflexota bacterium]